MTLSGKSDAYEEISDMRLVHELANLQRLPGTFADDNVRDSLKRALEG